MSKVKAAVLTNFGRIETRFYPYPDVPADGMLVKMRLCGVCGTDKHLFDGREPSLDLPVILGHEVLGEVEEVGKQAAASLEVHGVRLKKGDRVTWFAALPCGECWYCKWAANNHVGILCERGKAYGVSMTSKTPPHLFGGYAEYVYIVPGTWVYKIPESLPDKVAVLIDIFASVGGIKKAMAPAPALKEGFGPADTVAIQGSGPIGLAAAMTAKLSGAYEIVLIGGPKHRLDLARTLGIFDHIIDLEDVPDPGDRVQTVKGLTPGKVGPDLVVECTGVPSAVAEGLEYLRRGGTFVELGCFTDTGDVVINPFRHLCHKEVNLIGQYGCPPQYYDVAIKLVEMAWKLGWPLDRLVTHEFPVTRAQEAVEAHKNLICMKAVIDPTLGA